MSARRRRVAVKTEDEPPPVVDDGQQAIDEDDQVVREIDVYLSPAMASKLYLMQFPLQHGEVALPDAARIKPNHGMLELDHDIPQEIGHNGAFALRQRTHVSHTIPVSTHMALGKMNEQGSLELIPLSHIVQMRPSFSHVNQVEHVPEEAQEEEKMEKKPVLFQKKETERAALARKSSFAFKRASEEAEAWRMLTVCGPDTVQHRQTKKGLVCPSPSKTLGAMTTTDQDASSAFVRSLNYLPATGDDDQAMADEGAASMELTQICARLTTLLERGWPVPYSVLKHQFPVDDNDLLTALTSCAVLVRGNFVLQSRFLPLSSALQEIRTFILYVLQTCGYVERVRLSRVFSHETPEAMEMLLNQVAVKTLNGWQPKLQDDAEFCNLFPEQTQLHIQYWERQAIRFSDYMELYYETE